MSNGAGKSINNTQAQKPTNTTTRKSPSQTCVSPAENQSKQQNQQKHHKKRGQSPTRTPTKSMCRETQWLVHCITRKNVPNELKSRLSGKHEA